VSKRLDVLAIPVSPNPRRMGFATAQPILRATAVPSLNNDAKIFVWRVVLNHSAYQKISFGRML
jgi:hypothetical protein